MHVRQPAQDSLGRLLHVGIGVNRINPGVVGKLLTEVGNGAKDPLKRRAWLIASLSANLGTIAFFKYYNFFVSSAKK